MLKKPVNKFAIITLVLILSLGAGLVIFINTHKFQSNNIHSEMTRLPNDVKKSISSVLANSNTLVAKPTRVPILMFHYVEYVKNSKDKIRKSLSVSPLIFDKQIQTLTEAGYTYLNTQDLIDIGSGKMELPKKPVMLTFDDGYRDFYTDAYPVLKKYNAKAIAYVVPGFLNRPNNLYKWQLEQIAKDGLVEIGAHTTDHLYLKGMPKMRASAEVVNSKTQLEQIIGKPVLTFAYPYGAFDLQTVQIVKNAGFIDAVSTIAGYEITPENQFFLYRLRAGARTGKELLNFLEQIRLKK